MAEELTILDKLGVNDGLKLTYERVVTAEDIDLFAKVSGDYNPVHVNEDYAKKTLFKGRIAHGALSQAFLSTTMAKLPGVVIFHRRGHINAQGQGDCEHEKHLCQSERRNGCRRGGFSATV